MTTADQQALLFEPPAVVAPQIAVPSTTADNAVARAYAMGRLLVQIDGTRKAADLSGNYVGSEDIHGHEEVRVVHVISKVHGGEVHGYVLARGSLRLRGPAYAGEWTDLDALVSRVVGAPIEPYVLRSGRPIKRETGR